MRNFVQSMTIGLIVVRVALAEPASTLPASTQPTAIETSRPPEGGRGLATMIYSPTTQEAAHLKRVDEPEINHWIHRKAPRRANEPVPDPEKVAAQEKADAVALAAAKAYTLDGQAGKLVGWFGIVRATRWDAASGQTQLTLEHCHFDGLVDAHQQIVSLYGAGDFKAMVRGKAEAVIPLTLVRVYGVASANADGTATVTADYVRVWGWGLFAFMDYGIDKTNPKWVALRKLDPSNVYTSRPTADYYEALLGKRNDANVMTR